MKNELVKTGAKIGAGVGTLVWFLFGIIAGFHFGGYSSIILMNKLMGSIEPTLFTKSMVVIGAMLGIATIGTMCLVVGGLLGALTGYMVSPITTRETMAQKSN